MRRDDTDLMPVLAIFAGAAAGLFGTALLLRTADAGPALAEPPAAETVHAPGAEPVVRTITAADPSPTEAIGLVDWLLHEQREIRRAVQDMPIERDAERIQVVADLRERKGRMGSALRSLEADLGRAATFATTRDTYASGVLRGAASHIAETNLKEAVDYSRGTIEEWDRESALALEQDIEGTLVGLRRELLPLTPTFTPFSVAPSVRNSDEVVAALGGAYPTELRDAGIGGTVNVYVYVDADGAVRNTRLDRSSGHTALDEAALSVAAVYRFSPALDHDARVPVWVSFPITFRSR